ncbi:MAG: GGDEF domain-containing protein [Thermotogota bacterium]
MKNDEIGLIFKNIMDSKNVGLFVLKDHKVKYINNNFKNYLNKLGIEPSHRTLFEINKNYNQDFKIYKKYSFLKELLIKYEKFNMSDDEESINYSMAFAKFDIEIFYNAFIHNGEKYNIFTIKPLHKNLKVLNNKFFDISKKINQLSFKNLSKSSFNSYEIFNQIFSILKKELMLDAFVVALEYKNDIKISFGKIKDNDFSGIFLPNHSLTGYICNQEKSVYIKNSLEIDIPKKIKVFHVAKPEIYSVFGIPFDDGNGSKGAILFERKGYDNFINHEIKLLEELSYTILSILKYAKLYEDLIKEKEKLYDIAIKDKLTNAYNRVFLSEYLQNALEKAERYDEKFILIFVDIDGFKDINDKFGHNYGDTCLVFFAETIFDCIRKSDILARYGGDEFLIVLNETSLKEGKKIIERIDKKLKNSHFNLSISYGLFELDKNLSIEDNLNKVDKLMYEMKYNK